MKPQPKIRIQISFFHLNKLLICSYEHPSLKYTMNAEINLTNLKCIFNPVERDCLKKDHLKKGLNEL